MIRILDIEGHKVIPTEHCYTIKWLKVIMDNYPKNYMKVYAYLFYVSCPSKENPYFNTKFEVREETILQDVECDFNTEDDVILEAIEKLSKLYETPTVRAYKSVTILLDNIGRFIEHAQITTGRDGSLTALMNTAKNFDALRQSFKGVAKDLEEEQDSRVRGGEDLAYDQE